MKLFELDPGDREDLLQARSFILRVVAAPELQAQMLEGVDESIVLARIQASAAFPIEPSIDAIAHRLTFGKVLETFRGNLSQERVQKETGILAPRLRSYESGRAIPSTIQIFRWSLARGLNAHEMALVINKSDQAAKVVYGENLVAVHRSEIVQGYRLLPKPTAQRLTALN